MWTSISGRSQVDIIIGNVRHEETAGKKTPEIMATVRNFLGTRPHGLRVYV